MQQEEAADDDDIPHVNQDIEPKKTNKLGKRSHTTKPQKKGRESKFSESKNSKHDLLML